MKTSSKKINPAYYIGKGKLLELKGLIDSLLIDMVAFDENISSTQIRNLSKYLNVPILDRKRVILDIFAKRALTSEGKIQVELAGLKIKLPELINRRASLDQQPGFIGAKGIGERSLELTRREIMEKIRKLQKKLKVIEKQRKLKREKRTSSSLFIISIVGYTNAGKSTLFNILTKETLPTDNLLFHTLDTRIRKGFLSNAISEVLFIDTVGFIRKLPHELIESFKSTLEEIKTSDLIITVVDISDPDFEFHIKTVKDTLKELGANQINNIFAYNKVDKVESEKLEDYKMNLLDDGIFISSINSYNIDELKNKIIHVIENKIRN